MSKQIRNLGMFLMLCYMALFVQVNRWTVFDAEELKEQPDNNRQEQRDFASPRGTISTADGAVLAESVEVDDRWERQRRYPEGDLFGHITGHFSLWIGSSGLEEEYNAELAGRDLDITLDTIDDLFVEKDRVGNLTLTMRKDVQQTARDMLDGRRGSVVALDPRSGDILAMYSNPTYDPNVLSVHDPQAAELAAARLNDDPVQPRLARTYQNRYPPGSTFKVVTATAGVEKGTVTPDNPNYQVSSAYQAPNVGGEPIGNFGGGSCGGTLFEILARSCNTAFAEMGVEQAGPDQMVRTAQAFGYDEQVPIDLPPPLDREEQVQSVFPEETQADQILAQLSIGQNENAATPLQMALVAAAVANGGEIMEPHVLGEIVDDDGEVIREYDDEVWQRAMSAETAGVMFEAMQGVVDNGTADGLRDSLSDSNIVVGGKTGTAQTGRGSHAWIIGFAGPEGEPPQVAVAVILESVPGVNDDQTGGTYAAPIASEVMRVALTPPASPAQEGQQQGEGQGG